MAKVAIDIGHILNDTGAVANGFREIDLNDPIARACEAELRRNGVEVIVTMGSLENRCLVANANNVDLFVSVHNNCGGGDGTEVFHAPNSTKGTTLAANILNEIMKAGLNNSRGVKEANYYVLKHTKAPACLVECAFMDTADIQAVDTHEERVAFGKAIARGILATLGIAVQPNVCPMCNRPL